MNWLRRALAGTQAEWWANRRGEAGDPAGAVTQFARLLAGQRRVLGPNHPRVLNTRGFLAHWQGQAGDTPGAAAAYAELLADRMRLLGPYHPDTLRTGHNHAMWRVRAGDPAGAVAAFGALLNYQQQALGPNHPDTLNTRANLAACRGEAGDVPGAAAAFAELVPQMERILGPGHPDTLRTWTYLAIWRGKAGDAAYAARTLAQLVPQMERIFGPADPRTASTRGNLAYWQGEAGRRQGPPPYVPNLWLGGDVEAARRDVKPGTSTLPVTIYLSDEGCHEQAEAAVGQILAAAGLQIVERGRPVVGSWFRQMTAAAWGDLRPAAAEAALFGVHAADQRLVLAQDASITSALLHGAAPVITSLQPTKDAVIRAGALLIVKADWTVTVLQLTAAQQAKLDHQPGLARSPHEIIAALATAVLDEDPPIGT